MKQYRKIIVGGKQLAVVTITVEKVGGELVERFPDFTKQWLKLKGIQFKEATPAEFVADYNKRYGEPVKV